MPQIHPFATGFLLVLGWLLPGIGSAQNTPNPFQPLEDTWRPANEVRLASGAPGPAYWQQKVDYDIAVELLEEGPSLRGSETITYHNRSPHQLDYLWLQLDQNLRRPDATARLVEPAPYIYRPENFVQIYADRNQFVGGFVLSAVADAKGRPLPHQIVGTNMRIDLPAPLAPEAQFALQIKWSYRINDARTEGRSGFEYFPKDENFLFEIAQFYPRLCAYDDINGWQNKPFYGPAEFALEFGDYAVAITAPENYLVTATGTLQNEPEVLSKRQQERLQRARTTESQPVQIVTPEEAQLNESKRSTDQKTWRYTADNVRDFAFAASRKFAWEAARVTIDETPVLAQALYPKEGIPLWDKYALHTVMHTLRTYSAYSVPYPYPTATTVHGAVWGMEYPMLSFCGGRPLASGFYSRQMKYSMIGVIIHEVGHNFFPMVVNSDERKWAWMDEGINSFLEYLTEAKFEQNFPHRRGPAAQFAPFMASPGHQSVMTNPESITSNGKTSYEKVTVALKILRDQVMGPEVFDAAFRRYAQRWAFKRPTPEDFFRTLEDASGQDLDWFWRNWFYAAEPLDLGIVRVKHFVLKEPEDRPPQEAFALNRVAQRPSDQPIGELFYVDQHPELRDRYTGQARLPDYDDRNEQEMIAELIAAEGIPMKRREHQRHVYHITFENVGGCVAPIPFELVFRDRSTAQFRLPAEVWMRDPATFTKQVAVAKEVVAIRLDADLTLPDTDRKNNFFPDLNRGQRIQTYDLRPE